MILEKYFEQIRKCSKLGIDKDIALDNMRKGRNLAYAAILLEAILCITDIIANFLKADNRFKFDNYLFAYLFFIVFNALFILYSKKYKYEKTDISYNYKLTEIIVLIYVTLMMSWGSVISLMDQKLYGQLMVYMVNTIVCSVIFVLDNKKMLIPYLISAAIIMIGLPYFQKSSDVLVGHYVNLIVFLTISFISSRIVYVTYYNEFYNKELLKKSHSMLEDIINQNKEINQKLSNANNQLKELALIDELTGIANRRSFRNFIDLTYDNLCKENVSFSVIMIDIDFFKEYNDNYGHIEGDKVLISVANEMNSVVKKPLESVARWGGEEFLYAAFNQTDEYVKSVAEEIKSKISKLKIPHEYSMADEFLSISIGIYTTNIHSISDVARVIDTADKVMYSAKEAGRNKIMIKED